MQEQTNFLQEQYTIDTPENVTFSYDVAGIGSRFIGALVDTLLLLMLMLLINLTLALVASIGRWADGLFLEVVQDGNGWLTNMLYALYILFNFVIIWGYYIVFELLWNGQTPGKRVAKTRVVQMNGNPVGFINVAIRNLVRIIDFMPSLYAVGLITMFVNRHARRLGDFAAGTMVIHAQSEISLKSLNVLSIDQIPAASSQHDKQELTPAQAALVMRYPKIRSLSLSDYELIREMLRRHDDGTASSQKLRRLSALIATKLEVDDPSDNWSTARNFLLSVAEAYQLI